MPEPKLIEWALLCLDAKVNERGGVDALHIFDKFSTSELPHLSMVIGFTFEIDDAGWAKSSVYPPITGNFLFGFFLKDETGQDIYTHRADFIVMRRIMVASLSHLPIEKPGKYTIELHADGAPQCKLDLFMF